MSNRNHALAVMQHISNVLIETPLSSLVTSSGRSCASITEADSAFCGLVETGGAGGSMQGRKALLGHCNRCVSKKISKGRCAADRLLFVLDPLGSARPRPSGGFFSLASVNRYGTVPRWMHGTAPEPEWLIIASARCPAPWSSCGSMSGRRAPCWCDRMCQHMKNLG